MGARAVGEWAKRDALRLEEDVGIQRIGMKVGRKITLGKHLGGCEARAIVARILSLGAGINKTRDKRLGKRRCRVNNVGFLCVTCNITLSDSVPNHVP